MKLINYPSVKNTAITLIAMSLVALFFGLFESQKEPINMVNILVLFGSSLLFGSAAFLLFTYKVKNPTSNNI